MKRESIIPIAIDTDKISQRLLILPSTQSTWRLLFAPLDAQFASQTGNFRFDLMSWTIPDGPDIPIFADQISPARHEPAPFPKDV
jgi:hypothetical protein